jgi:hypothetical protein
MIFEQISICTPDYNYKMTAVDSFNSIQIRLEVNKKLRKTYRFTSTIRPYNTYTTIHVNTKVDFLKDNRMLR